MGSSQRWHLMWTRRRPTSLEVRELPWPSCGRDIAPPSTASDTVLTSLPPLSARAASRQTTPPDTFSNALNIRQPLPPWIYGNDLVKQFCSCRPGHASTIYTGRGLHLSLLRPISERRRAKKKKKKWERTILLNTAGLES